MSVKIICDENLTGTYNQCLAVAEKLGDTEQPVIISAGRRSFLKAALYKLKNPNAFWVWLQKPPSPWPRPDLIAAPMHDRITGKNTIQTVGAPNRITAQSLETAKQQFPQFENLKSPRVAVLIGGNSKNHAITPAIIQKLCHDLSKLDAGIMVTASRRTGEDNIQLLKAALPDHAYFWDGTGDNPYHAMLACADHIICTNDSVSMLSDAATTGKPVHVVRLDGGTPKFERFYSELNRRNITKPFDGGLRMWSYEPLRDAALVADKIKQHLNT